MKPQYEQVASERLEFPGVGKASPGRLSAIPFLRQCQDATALALIGFYQRRLSPLKGFSCAHRILHKGTSCSSHAVELIGQVGVFGAVSGMWLRFAECRAAYMTLCNGTILMMGGLQPMAVAP